MTDNLVGLIPAAGKGVRLGLPYPKELYPIIRDNRYKPISQFVVENMTATGVKDIIFVINETKHQLIGYFGNGFRFGCNFSYVVQENRGNENSSSSPGLAHALDSAYHLILGKTVLFGMADTIMEPIDVFRYLLNAASVDDQVILGLFEVSRPEKFGIVEIQNNGIVRQIIDKPDKTNLRHAWGCIVWRKDFTEHLHNLVNNDQISDFAEIMNNAIYNGMVIRGVVLPDAKYFDLGTYAEIAELESIRSNS
jgi:glucose-1-phosphate thymidylyltransferase